MYHVGYIQLQMTEIPNKLWFKQIGFILVALQEVKQGGGGVRSAILGWYL